MSIPSPSTPRKAVSTLNLTGASSSSLRSFTSQAEPLSNTEALNQPFFSLCCPSIHPPTPASNTQAYPSTLPGSATIPPGSANLHSLLSIAYITLLFQLNPGSSASTASNQHIAFTIHSATPDRHPLPYQLLLPPYLSKWRRFALSAHNSHSSIIRQLNAIQVLFPGRLVDGVEREPSSSFSADDEGGEITNT